MADLNGDGVDETNPLDLQEETLGVVHPTVVPPGATIKDPELGGPDGEQPGEGDEDTVVSEEESQYTGLSFQECADRGITYPQE